MSPKSPSVWIIIIGVLECIVSGLGLFFVLPQIEKLNSSLNLNYFNSGLSYSFYLVLFSLAIFQVIFGFLLLKKKINNPRLAKSVLYLGVILFVVLLIGYHLFLIVPVQNIANS